MNNTFFLHIYNHPLIKEGDLLEIIAEHQRIEFAKGDVILEYGKTANEYYLVESGLFRVYVHDYQGNEVTTAFYAQKEIAIEVSSMFQRIPTQENIVALTDSVAWKIDFEVFEALFQRIEGFREWGRTWMSNQLFLSKQRAMDILTKNATERYLSLIKDRPEIVQQAPVKYIASYLGVTDTSLSRIRREINQGEN